MTQVEDKIKFALAIYKGLPDVERANKLREWRALLSYEARTLVTLCEHHEAMIRREQDRMRSIEIELQSVREQLAYANALPPVTHYGQVRNPESSRAAFGIGVLFAGVGGVYWACSSFGVWPVVIGSAVILALANISSSRGRGDSDVERKSAEAGHTVVVNVNVGNGQATVQNG